MNAMPDSFVVNSCQYTPVYLIQDPGASQGQSYFITQSNIEDSKPVSDNLKAFYESSGNIEGFVSVNSSPKPRILKKQDNGAVGNNLKLASFLQPKNESLKHQYLMNGMIVKPNVTLNSSNSITSSSTYTTGNNTRLNIDSKIVKLKDVALKTRHNRIERVPQPKNNKPKDVVTAIIPVTVPVTTVQVPLNVPTVPATVITTVPAQVLPTKYTSVQLLKLGETYHSVNELSDEQMKMVAHALKIFSNPEKIAPEPTYDPVTNTQYIYKVVSPRDLTVVGKNKVPPHKLIEAARIENIMTKELKKEILIETAKKEYIQEAYKKEHSKENIEKELLAKYRARQEKFIAEARKEKLKAEARKENLLKAIAKREMLLKAEAKKERSKAEAKKEEMKREEHKKELIMRKADEEKFKNLQKEILDEQEEKESKTKVTRSGRKVKLPKSILPVDTPHKPKKKTTLISCFQCSSEFNSLYRLQKHYESHPTHIPSKIHSNLFHCLLAIVLSGAEGDRSNIFLQQLQHLVLKLRSLMPCLLSEGEGSAQAATVSDDVGSLLGLYPGEYTFDITALDCIRNTEGYCRHNPPPPPPKVEPDTAANQTWATINEDLPTSITSEIETDDCARINSVEKWPTVSKRVWKQKQRKSARENAKRMRLASENNDSLIELGIDDFVGLSNTSCTEKCSAIIQVADSKADSNLVNDACNNFEDSIKLAQVPESLDLPQEPEPNDYLNPNPTSLLPDTANLEQIVTNIVNLEEQTKHNNHLQFHSAHFDIRSSPIKPTSTVFRKFRINPEVLAKYEPQIIRSIETVDKNHETSLETNETDNHNETEHFKEVPSVLSDSSTQNKEDSSEDTDHLVGDDTLGEIFRDEELSAVKESFILDRELKDWILNRSNDDKSEDGFGKSNTLIEPSLIHVKDHEIKSVGEEIGQKTGLQPSDNHDESSVLNFLDTFGNDSLSFPGTEIRTNGDFQLDLFSFHSS